MLSVKLAEPLGSRRVIDAGSLRRVRLEGPSPGDPVCPPFRELSDFEQITRENQQAGLPADPRASSGSWTATASYRLTNAEARTTGHLEPSRLCTYLLVHRDEYAGEVRVGDFPEPRRIIFRFSGHAAEHEAALKGLFRRSELISTETVGYTMRQLQAIEDRLRRDAARTTLLRRLRPRRLLLPRIETNDGDGVVELEVVGTRGDATSYFAAPMGPSRASRWSATATSATRRTSL